MRMTALGIGERLRNARQAQGLSLEEVESATRIRRPYLDALEREAFEDLPGPAYVRGFIRSYAAYLGLSPAEVLEAYPVAVPWRGGTGLAARRDSPVEVRLTPATPFSRTRRLLTGIGIVVALGILALAYAFYTQIREFAQNPPPAIPRATPAPEPSGGSPPSGTRGPSQTPPAVVPPAGPPTVSPAPTGSVSVPPAPSVGPAPAPPAVPPPQRAPRPAPSVAAPPPTAAPSTLPGAPERPSGPQSPSPGPSAGAGSPRAGALLVVVAATDRVWVRAVADGAVVFEGFVNAGDRQAWEATRQITVRVGNAGAVDVSVNGRSVGRLGAPGAVVERTFQAETPP